VQQLDFERIKAHISHHIVAITYGSPPVNAAIECETCGTVLYSADPAPSTVTPTEMWHFQLLAGGLIPFQAFAGVEFEDQIRDMAIVESAKALGIPLAELTGERDDAWSEILETVRDHAYDTVRLQLVTMLQLKEPLRPLAKPPALTRPVEVYRLWPEGGGDRGSWDTAYVEIPRDTPEDQIALVAAERHHAELVLHRQAVVSVGFYNLPPLEEGEDIPGMDVDAFVTFAWMYDDLDRSAVLDGVRLQIGDLTAILDQQTWPLEALRQEVADEAAGIVADWAGLRRGDKLEAIGRWLTCMAVKMRMESTPTLSGVMLAQEITTLVITPVAQSLESVARSRS